VPTTLEVEVIVAADAVDDKKIKNKIRTADSNDNECNLLRIFI
jgi:hypothetical protein